MAKKKKTSTDYKSLFLTKIRQNYPSLILGVVIVLLAIFVITRFFKNPPGIPSIKKKGEQIVKEKKREEKREETSSYKVKKGDTLWSIAEKFFGSGYNAYDIASANKLKNPDLIEVNQEIIIPKVTPKQPTRGVIAKVQTKKVTLTEKNYTVKKGDYLWKIALEAYGDGYQWVKIAQANRLANPDLIHPGNVLKIP